MIYRFFWFFYIDNIYIFDSNVHCKLYFSPYWIWNTHLIYQALDLCSCFLMFLAHEVSLLVVIYTVLVCLHLLHASLLFVLPFEASEISHL